MHAWFSAKQKDLCGYVIYEREDGTPVVCTSVSKTEVHGLHFNDVSYLGEVSRFVSSHKTTKFNFHWQENTYKSS